MLKSSLKGYTYGQDKVFPPEQVIQKVSNQLKQDDVALLDKIISLDIYDKIGIPVYMCQLSLKKAKEAKFKETFGKGVTPEQAQASALMELVERYSGNCFLKNESLIESYNKLEEEALSIETLLSPLAFPLRENVFIEHLRNIPLRWVKAYHCSEDKEILFPLHWFHCIYGTTGWAAGNSLEEAVLQAICEIIERHCVSTIMEEKLNVPTIEVDSIESPLVKELLKKLFDAGLEVIIKDFSLDLGIPTLAVIVHDPLAPTPTVRVYAAAGTHLNPALALIRALIEFSQHRAQIIYRELVQRLSGGPTYCFKRFKTLEEADFLLKGDKISFDSLPHFSHPDFKVEIKHLLSLILPKGFDVFIIETTHPVLKIPSVIITIPGARLNRPSTKLHPYLLFARQLMDIKQYKEALNYIEETFEQEPSYSKLPQILCQAAVCAKMAKDYQKAVLYYQQAAEISPHLFQSQKFVADFTEALSNIKSK